LTTFVLVHGAWSWRARLPPRPAAAAGRRPCRVHAQLTGVGERVHLASPLVNLSTHVRDVVNHVLFEDLQQIALVGFSYGGCVVTGALEHIADRVAHLVFLDAFVPAHGESLSSHLGGPSRPAIEIGEEWLVAAAVREFDDPAEGEWVKLRRTRIRAPASPSRCIWPAARSVSVHADVHQGTVSVAGEPGAAAFWRAAKHAEASPRMAILRESRPPHGVEQQAGRDGELLMRATDDER
jgi:pimeloyl-ACP methyl ester carboxylesterase